MTGVLFVILVVHYLHRTALITEMTNQSQINSLVAAGSFVTEERCADEIEMFNFEKVLRNIVCGRCQK